ncbi:hypothetical protein ACHHYP_00482 [Achlya hypogyna]|uniref:Uncharacterized protein n=1 Tax=Achlya hypogyna TaxID=1202772 RepID=A0A1V9ZAP7_ACHHY|nr:hypothetical protein ACHHYP_00482 [Achlya hypogyna]
METLLRQIRDGADDVYLEAMEKEGLKHVFMEILEMIRVEDAANLTELSRWTNALATVLRGLPPTKRGIYLGDAISMLMRKSSGHEPLDVVVLDFLLALQSILTTTSEAPTAVQDHKKVLYALLSVLGRSPLRYVSAAGDSVFATISTLLEGGHCIIPIEHLLATHAWRQYVRTWRRLVAPCTSHTGEEASDEDDSSEDDDDDASEIQAEVRRVAEARLWAAIPDPLGVKYLGPDLIGSDLGIAVAAYWLCVFEAPLWSTQRAALGPRLLDIVSPYAQLLLNEQTSALKAAGVNMLAVAVNSKAACVEVIAPEQFDDVPTKVIGIEALARREFGRHGYKDLLQNVLTTMVMVSDAATRQATLRVWQQIVDTVAVPSRFHVLSHLSLRCPFPNAAAVVVDRIRSEVARHWNDYYALNGTQVVALVAQLLAPRADSAFVEHTDMYMSGLSLYRFLLLRDKDNATGVHSHTGLPSALRGQLRRLKDLVATEIQLGPVAHAHCPPENSASPLVTLEMAASTTQEATGPPRYDLFRLQLMEGGFDAALAAAVNPP